MHMRAVSVLDHWISCQTNVMLILHRLHAASGTIPMLVSITQESPRRRLSLICISQSLINQAESTSYRIFSLSLTKIKSQRHCSFAKPVAFQIFLASASTHILGSSEPGSSSQVTEQGVVIMADVKRQRLLSSFPRPPSSLLSPSPTRPGDPSPMYRAADFGFIHVGLDTQDNEPLYEEGIQRVQSNPQQATPSGKTGDGALHLVLDDPNKLYSPGETITGYISGWDMSSAGTHVHVFLEGRAKTFLTIGGNPGYHERAPIFYQVAYLQPNGTIPRFSIAIPERAQLVFDSPNEASLNSHKQYWKRYWASQEPFEVVPGHPLPPSILLPARTSNTLRESATCRGYVEYKLTAVRSKLDTTTQRLVSDATAHVPVWLTTLRLPEPRASALLKEIHTTASDLSVQTLQLSKARKLSIYEQLRDPFRADTPGFSFTSQVTVPKVSVPGGTIKVAISVAIQSPPAGRLYNFPIPDIAISDIMCSIQSYQGIRFADCPPAITGRATQSKAYIFKNVELRSSRLPSQATFRPNAGEYRGQSCVVTIALPVTLVPSFKTYNMWRSYRIKCDVVFAVAGKKVTARTKSDLSIIARPGAEAASDALRSHCVEREEEVLSVDMAKAVLVGLVPERGYR
ncbi:hypothetical protein BDV96DRAFT_370986 [Lophiotrema nucula]|uniref:Arrestin-like N-terminal domain-containing protein n=1 Tax=Lophiotrema nucula TaxID=690887 RepID=A0A6A5ZI21_9PLEO|nr:hypothetical protein BDV96DRAFT_370986 [Lophiotrema nucula]